MASTLKNRAKLAIGVALALSSAPVFADPISTLVFLSQYVGTTIAAFIASHGVTLLFSAAITVYGNSTAKRKASAAKRKALRDYNRGLEDRTVTVLQAQPPARVIIGRRLVGGDIVAIFTTDDTNAVTEKGNVYTKVDGLKHLVIYVASHECQAINDVRLNGELVGALDINGWATGGPYYKSKQVLRQATFTGSVTLSTPVDSVKAANVLVSWDGGIVPATVVLSNGNKTITCTSHPSSAVTVEYLTTVSNGAVRVSKHLGSSSQTVDTYLNGLLPDKWTTNHRLRGMTYIVLTLKLTDERFQSGPPEIQIDVSGAKLYDPRTGLTTFSSNAALAAAYVLTSKYGRNVPYAQIDEPYLIAAANACDESIVVEPWEFPVTYGPRYTCDGSFTTEDDPSQVLEAIADSMGGFIVEGPKWLILAGTWVPPLATTFTDEYLDGHIEILQVGDSLNETCNSARGTYVKKGETVPRDLDPYTNPVFVAADGEQYWKDFVYPLTDNKTRARNLMRISVERTRSSLVIKYPGKLECFGVLVGDRVKVTNAEYGFNEKLFRVTNWQFSSNSPVILTMQEDDPSIYDLADESSADPTPNSDLPKPWEVLALTGVIIESGTNQLTLGGDGSIIPRVKVSWTLADSTYVQNNGWVEVRWRKTHTTDWVLLRVDGDETSTFITGVSEGMGLMIEVRARNSEGFTGPSIYNYHVVVGKTQLPPNVSGLAHTMSTSGVQFYWNPIPDLDYSYTEVRYNGTSYDTSTFMWRGKGTTFEWLRPPVGTYTVRVKHYDTSGNSSATAASLNVTVDYVDTVNWTDIGGSGKPSDGATTDMLLIARGTAVYSGNTISKPTGSNAWDGDVYSKDGHTLGAYVSAVPAQNNKNCMFGLNTDPLTNTSYSSIDYAIYPADNGYIYRYESGAPVSGPGFDGSIGTYVAGDLLAVSYDGAVMRWEKNGIPLAEKSISILAPLFMDSSVYHPGVVLKHIRFVPWSTTDTLAVVEFFDAAGIAFSSAS